MKLVYILAILIVLGTCRSAMSQNTELMQATGIVQDSSKVVSTSTRQLNLVLPANGGAYIDATSTVLPYLGYSILGTPKAYTMFNGISNQFEYHQSSDAIPDFYINGGAKAVFNTGFLGLGTSTATTLFTGFAMKSNNSTWYGMYIDAGASGRPFYGYALNGVPAAYTQFNGVEGQYEYFQSNSSNPDFIVKGNSKAVFNTSFLGVGTSSPTTFFTGFALKSAANSYWGMYIDAGATGQPFYGYALNGVAKAYTQFNGTNNQFEYYHNSDASPDFLIGSTTAAFPVTTFLGVGTTTPTTSFTGFALKNSSNSYWGMYVDAGATGQPFYGYALNGQAKAYTVYNGTTNQFEYHHNSDFTPDFLISSNTAAFPATSFLGIGTTTPTTSFTGLALKSSSNSYWGMYIDAGTTGQPFYGYALDGVAKAYTQYNGTLNQFEYYQSSDASPDFYIKGNSKAVFNTAFVGIGTSTPTTGADALTIKTSAAGYFGMYIDAGVSGLPFYGYAINGLAKAWTNLNGNTNNWELNYNGTQIVVTPAGNVGIGTTLPTQKLDVNGTIHALNLNGGATSLSTDASGNIIRTPSDARLKCGITDIDRPLEKVLKLRGVTYNFIDTQRFGTDRQMGFLAQDLEKVVPETVSSGGEYKSVNYQEITALLTEAIKEQQRIITELKDRIEVLESNQK